MLLSSHFCRPTTPIDSTFCYAYTLVGTLGGPTIGHSRPRGGPAPSSSISVCTWLMEARLPSNRRKAKLPPLYPGKVTYCPWGSPSYPPLYRCMYPTGGRFSSANKAQECMGLTFVLYWSFSSPTRPFQPHQGVDQV